MDDCQKGHRDIHTQTYEQPTICCWGEKRKNQIPIRSYSGQICQRKAFSPCGNMSYMKRCRQPYWNKCQYNILIYHGWRYKIDFSMPVSMGEFIRILINCFFVVWKQKMVNNRKKSVVHIYEVGQHGAENRNGKTYIFLKRGKIPFFAFKIFLCLVILIKMRLRMMLMMMRMMAVMTNTYILIFSSLQSKKTYIFIEEKNLTFS